MLAVLERNQHLVHQWNGQVGRHLAGRGAQQHEHKAQQQLAPVGPRKAPQAQQRPGGGRRVNHRGANRAFLLVGLQRRFATGAHRLQQRRHRQATDRAVLLRHELVHQAQCLQVLAQGEAPAVQQPVGVQQFQVADARVVVVGQRQVRAVGPLQRAGTVLRQTEQAPVGGQQQRGHEVQALIQVKLQPGKDVLSVRDLRRAYREPMGWNITRRRGGNREVLGHGSESLFISNQPASMFCRRRVLRAL